MNFRHILESVVVVVAKCNERSGRLKIKNSHQIIGAKFKIDCKFTNKLKNLIKYKILSKCPM